MLPGWNQIRQARHPQPRQTSQQHGDNNQWDGFGYNHSQQQPGQMMGFKYGHMYGNAPQPQHGMGDMNQMGHNNQRPPIYPHQMMGNFEMQNQMMIPDFPPTPRHRFPEPPLPTPAPPVPLPMPVPPPPPDEQKPSPPPLPSTKEWWKEELTKCSEEDKKKLESLVQESQFLSMNQTQQVECWQKRLKESNQTEDKKDRILDAEAATKATIAKPPSITRQPNEEDPNSSKPFNQPTTAVIYEWTPDKGKPHESLVYCQQQIEKLKEQEKKFENQYTEWHKQFEEWKDKHKHHPNKNQFVQYEQQWFNWQNQMKKQKEQNHSNKEIINKNMKKIQEFLDQESSKSHFHQDSNPNQYKPRFNQGQSFNNRQQRPNNFGNSDQQRQNNFGNSDQQRQNNFGNSDQQRQNNFGNSDQQRQNNFGNSDQQRPNNFGNNDQQRQNNFGNSDQQRPNNFGNSDQQRPNNFGNSNQQRQNNFGNSDQQRQNNFGNSNQQRPNKFGNIRQQRPNNFGNSDQQIQNNFGQNVHGGPRFPSTRPRLPNKNRGRATKNMGSNLSGRNTVELGSANRMPRPRFHRNPSMNRPRFPVRPRFDTNQQNSRMNNDASFQEDYTGGNDFDDDNYEELYLQQLQEEETRMLALYPDSSMGDESIEVDPTPKIKDDFYKNKDLKDYQAIHASAEEQHVVLLPDKTNRSSPYDTHQNHNRYSSSISQTQTDHKVSNEYSHNELDLPSSVKTSEVELRFTSRDIQPSNQEAKYENPSITSMKKSVEKLFGNSPGKPETSVKVEKDGSINQVASVLESAKKIVATNPLFSGENLKRLQEQLKAVQNKTLDTPSSSKSTTTDGGNILKKAKDLSSVDLKNILSAVKGKGSTSTDASKSGSTSTEKSDAALLSNKSLLDDVLLSRPDVSDPLLSAIGASALSELSAALREDLLLQEYLKYDPLLEQELLLQILQDKELEARRLKSPFLELQKPNINQLLTDQLLAQEQQLHGLLQGNILRPPVDNFGFSNMREPRPGLMLGPRFGEFRGPRPGPFGPELSGNPRFGFRGPMPGFKPHGLAGPNFRPEFINNLVSQPGFMHGPRPGFFPPFPSPDLRNRDHNLTAHLNSKPNDLPSDKMEHRDTDPVDSSLSGQELRKKEVTLTDSHVKSPEDSCDKSSNETRDRPPIDSRDRPPSDSRDRLSFDSRDRPSSESHDRPPYDSQDRLSYDGRDSRDRPPIDSHDRPPNNSRDRPPNDSRDRPPMDFHDRPPYDSRDRPPYDRRDRPLIGFNDRPPYDSHDRPPYDSHDRPPYESRDRPPYDSRDRPPNDSRDRPPIDSRDRPPYDSRDRPPFDSRDRPPYDSHDRPRYDSHDRPPFDSHDRPPFDSRDGPPRTNYDRQPSQSHYKHQVQSEYLHSRDIHPERPYDMPNIDLRSRHMNPHDMPANMQDRPPLDERRRMEYQSRSSMSSQHDAYDRVSHDRGYHGGDRRSRNSMERVLRDIEDVKRHRETLDGDRREDELEADRLKRERSLERLRIHEVELRERENDLLERERQLREALPEFSDSDKRRSPGRIRSRSPHGRRSTSSSRNRLPQHSPPRHVPDHHRDRYHRSSSSPRRRERNRKEYPEQRDRDYLEDGRREDRRERSERVSPHKRMRSRSPRGSKHRSRSPRYKEVQPTSERRVFVMNERTHTQALKPQVIPTPNSYQQPPMPVDINPVLLNKLSSLIATQQDARSATVNDILNMPGRLKRPKKIVIILRGLPGSGKTHIAKIIRDKEIEFHVSPRVLGLDDYFMTEVEKVVKNPDSGKSSKKKVLEYEYEAEMEEAYRTNLIRSFKKTLEDGYFSFVILDAIHQKIKNFEDCYSIAKSLGFEVFVAEISADVHTCLKRNIHHRSLKEIEEIQSKWEPTPKFMNILDLRQLLQDTEIQEVEMGDISDSEKESLEMVRQPGQNVVEKSKWEHESNASQLDKLDGLKKKTVKKSMEDFLCVTEDYVSRTSAPGKKRVRWADMDERQTQRRMREVGFVVGGTDWSRMMDDSHADRALNRTKFI